MPKVSVLMTVYNGFPYIKDAISSILNQSFSDFELIIIDDASTDETANTIEIFNDRRIRYFKNSTNMGITRSANRGLSLAKSPYIARIDADDVSLPERLARQVEYLDQNQDIGVVGSAIREIDTKGRFLRSWNPPTSPQLIKWSLNLFDPIAHSTVLMRRKLVEQVQGYANEMETVEDYDLWRRLSKITKIANLSDVFGLIRRHSTNITKIRSGFHRERRIKVSQLMISDYLNKEISYETVRQIIDLEFDNKEDVQASAKVLSNLMRKGLNDCSGRPQDRQFIKQYAALRLLSISINGLNEKIYWKLLLSSGKLDPYVFWRAFNSKLDHLLLNLKMKLYNTIDLYIT